MVESDSSEGEGAAEESDSPDDEDGKAKKNTKIPELEISDRKAVYADDVPNGRPIMPMFLAPLAEKDDAEDSDSDEEVTEDKVEKFVNNMNRTEFETMPCPITIVSGAAGSVLPEKWCPQAATKKRREKAKRTQQQTEFQ